MRLNLKQNSIYLAVCTLVAVGFLGCGEDDAFRRAAVFDINAPVETTVSDANNKALSPESQEKINWVRYKEQCIDGCSYVINEDEQLDLKCSAIDEFSYDKPNADLLRLAMIQREGLKFYQNLAVETLGDKSLKGRSELSDISEKLALIPSELETLDLIISNLQDKEETLRSVP